MSDDQSDDRRSDLSYFGVKVPNQNSVKAKTSLLSTSIAAAQHQQQQQQQQQQQNQQQQQHNAFSQPIQIRQLQSDNDVPEEPSLFATSVGDNYSGRLVPSSSTISLFSLNSDNLISEDNTKQSQANYSTLPYERKNSLTSQLPRHNNTLHKQRHQHYMSALTPISSNPSTPSLKRMGSFQACEKSTSPKQIPYTSTSTFPPEPYLEPTSLNGSPSMFYLSSTRTPPASLGNTSNLQNYYKLQFQQQQQQQQQQEGGQGMRIQFDQSDRSPDLMPIGTPIDMPPMTPLLLNNNMEEFRFATTSDDIRDRD